MTTLQVAAVVLVLSCPVSGILCSSRSTRTTCTNSRTPGTTRYCVWDSWYGCEDAVGTSYCSTWKTSTTCKSKLSKGSTEPCRWSFSKCKEYTPPSPPSPTGSSLCSSWLTEATCKSKLAKGSSSYCKWDSKELKCDNNSISLGGVATFIIVIIIVGVLLFCGVIACIVCCCCMGGKAAMGAKDNYEMQKAEQNYNHQGF